MPADDRFATLMARLRAREDEAATRVFHRFAGRLLALARTRLGDALSAKLDPDDVLQSVFRSFFNRYHAGQFDLANWESLWGLLTVLTLRKCDRQVVHFTAARRDVRREVPLEPDDEFHVRWASLSSEPTPEEAALLTDTLARLMHGLEAADREILTRHLQGYTHYEISGQVGRSARTVRRVIERVRKHLHRLEEEERPP
jgi:RNA polymerase sigma-70 factor (ECF subfamily)